jgi:hypothetical protein
LEKKLMTSTAIRRRALVAVAGATAGLAAAFVASPADAAPAVQPPAAGPATDVQAGTALDESTVEATDTGQVSVTGEQAGALATCNLSARISGQPAYNRYKVAGSIGCTANGYLRMRCKPVHKHTFGWHSHDWAFDVTRFGSSLDRSSGWIYGTNGDTYKAHCEYWFNGWYLGAVESGTITL